MPRPHHCWLHVTFKSPRFIKCTQHRVSLCSDHGLHEGKTRKCIDGAGIIWAWGSRSPPSLHCEPGEVGAVLSVTSPSLGPLQPSSSSINTCGRSGRTQEGFREVREVMSGHHVKAPTFDHSDLQSPFAVSKAWSTELGPWKPQKHEHPCFSLSPGL